MKSLKTLIKFFPHCLNRTRLFFAALLLCVATCALLASCESERNPCLQPTVVYLRAHAVKWVDSTVKDTLLPQPRWFLVDSPVVFVFGKQTAQFSLPLNPLADSTRYFLQPDSANGLSDTVILFYDRKLQFLSNACGYTYFFTLNRIQSSRLLIDSIRILNKDVNSDVNTAEHVQIFF